MNVNHNSIEKLATTATSGSQNVYSDLGYENPEEVLLKAHLVRILNKAIKAKDLDRDRVAEILQLDRSQVLNLLRGQFRKYSLESLFKFLNSFDLDVEVNIKSKPEDRERSQTIIGADNVT